MILGVAGKPFSYDPRSEFGKALTAAESEAGGGKLSVTRWRDGKTGGGGGELPFSAATAPPPPSIARSQVASWSKDARRLPSGWPIRAIPAGWTRLSARSTPSPCWPAANPQYLPLVKKEAQWAAGFLDRRHADLVLRLCHDAARRIQDGHRRRIGDAGLAAAGAGGGQRPERRRLVGSQVSPCRTAGLAATG